MRFPMLGTALIASLAAASPALAAGPFEPIKIGNWSGGAFTNNQSGAFSHCAMSASYTSGVAMHATLNTGLGWNLGFSNRHWNLKPGDTIPVEMVFDGNGTIRISGKAVQPTLLVVSMPAESQLVRDFRGGNRLELFALGARYTFKLTSTAELMPALLNCVRQNGQLKVAPGTTPQGATTTADNGALQLEAVTLATNFLLKTQLPEPKVLSGSEAAPNIGTNGVAWRANGASGVVRVLTDPKAKDIDVAAAVSAADARGCQGRFASGRTTDPVEGSNVLRGFSSCEHEGKARYAEYYVVPRRQGGFAMFSVVTTGDGALHQQRRTDFQRAAMTATQ